MKLTMLSGLPGSGKTTKARNLVKESGNDGRINRDDLRAMLFDSVWNGKREKVVIECEKAIAKVLLDNKMNPIIDDTNLNSKTVDMWKNFAKDNDTKFENIFINTPINECVDRDFGRLKTVGTPIIHRMALENGMIDWGVEPIILVDLDGTLADTSKRQHFVDGEKKDWKSFFDNLIYDQPYPEIFKQVNELSNTHTVCIVSGRPDNYWNQTFGWFYDLSNKGIKLNFDYIFMRRSSDSRPDVDIKADILKFIPKEKITLVIDDRPVVCRYWESQGLNVQWARGKDIKEF